ncbi:MAG: biopolymer transporter ExbD, partial [Gemmatimonadota bacterium]|nr:biopolymer transporter ExbD [Gemmatimonadota bacterium]
DRAGRIFVDETPLTFADFRAAFPAMVTARQPTGVYLRADQRVDYGQVVRVLAVMRASGIGDVGLVAEAEEIGR